MIFKRNGTVKEMVRMVSLPPKKNIKTIGQFVRFTQNPKAIVIILGVFMGYRKTILVV